MKYLKVFEGLEVPSALDIVLVVSLHVVVALRLPVHSTYQVHIKCASLLRQRHFEELITKLKFNWVPSICIGSGFLYFEES